MLSNSNFSEVAALAMYRKPYFASTFRYAQFTRTVAHKEHYAGLVHTLDLSYIYRSGINDQGDLLPLAGWREFRYIPRDRNYVRNRMIPSATSAALCRLPNPSHPAPSALLKSFHLTRDIPIGGICHVLAACKQLKKLNLSRVQLATDFGLVQPELPISSISGMVFLSDVAKPVPWKSTELVRLQVDELISWICKLEILEIFEAKSSFWLSTTAVKMLCRESPERLQLLDFRGSGMDKYVQWAVRETRVVIEKLAR